MKPGKYHHLVGKLLNRIFLKDRRLLLTSLGVAGGVILIRFAGLLQGWELAVLDQLLQVRPLERRDDRIVIVSIGESDLHQLQRFPIPDQQMAQLIRRITIGKPSAIGLDIYRDIPVEPGHQDLLEVFKTTPNLIGIEHIGDEDGPTVPPPQLLQLKGQTGFNNNVHDPDDRVRRALLYFSPKDSDEAHQSFALALALKYLQAKGITPQVADNVTGNLQLGNAIFQRFKGQDGAFVRADDGGYQILINPRGPANSFQRISMMDIIAGRVSSEVFRDRVVLIGYTAISSNDFKLTSYSGGLIGSPESIPGVELHANILSQIISAAEDNRPLITSWSEPVEWLWILLWAWMGTCISWYVRSLRISATALIGIGVILIVTSFGLLLAGLWIPIVPPLLATTASAIVMIAHIARLEEEFRRSKDFLNTIINTIPDPIFVKDRQHRWIVINEAFSKFLHQPVEKLLAQTDYDLFGNEEATVFHEYDEHVFVTGEEHQNETSFTDYSGMQRYIETKRSLHKDAAGNLFLVGIIRDITERKHMEDDLKRKAAELLQSNAELQQSASHLSHLAHHDALTGLPNRKLFYERLQQAIDWAAENQQAVGLLFLDLDGFKQINDSKGHDVGDLLLKAVARRLSGCLRGSDTVSRLGGDEFTVILPAIPNAQDAARVATKVLDTLAKPFVIQGNEILVTSSVGISLYPENAQDLEMLVKAADNAMYRAKQQGKSRYEFSS